MHNSLAHLLRLCGQLHDCPDEELSRQLHQLDCACPEHLLQPVRLLLHTSLYLRQQLAALDPGVLTPAPAALPTTLALLTKRERAVLDLLAQGYTLPQIGEKLFISSDTVRNQCARMREKLGLRGRNSLMAFALANKVV